MLTYNSFRKFHYMKRYCNIVFIALLLCVTLGWEANAQQRIWGKVTESADKEPISGVVVRIIRANGSNGEYAMTNGTGEYEIKLKGDVAYGDSLSFQMLGYQTYKVALPADSPLNIELSAGTFSLNEVVIRAPKVQMSGDTISYNINAFAEKHDRSLENVLARLPGIEVLSNGTILYNGKAISNVYIEGMDVVNGRYSLITRNISAKNVKSVDVMDRHQRIKALSKLMPSDDAALNIKLKDSAKGNWGGNASINGGYSALPEFLWDINLYLMRLGKQWTSVNNIKSNDSGQDLNSEIEEKGSSVVSFGNGIVSLETIDAPLSSTRTLFNKSALVNSSNLFRGSNDWEFKASAAYYFDRLNSGSNSSTTYFFPDSTSIIYEGQSIGKDKHLFQAAFDAEQNRQYCYLNNHLTLRFSKETSLSDISGTLNGQQNVNSPFFGIDNDFKIIRKAGKISFTISSDNKFEKRNESLNIRIGDTPILQDIDSRRFASKTFVTADIPLRNDYVLAWSAGVNVKTWNMTSTLSGVGKNNDVSNVITMPFTSVMLKRSTNNLDLMIGGPINLTFYKFPEGGFIPSGRLGGAVRYKLSRSFDLNANASVSGGDPDDKDMFDGYLLKNYRMASTNGFVIDRTPYCAGVLSLKYKNIRKMYFLDLSLNYTRIFYNTITNNNYIDKYIVSEVLKAKGYGQSYGVSLTADKSIYGINGKIALTLSYRHEDSDASWQNGASTPFDFENFRAQLNFTGRLAPWISTNYNISFTHIDFSVMKKSASSRNNLVQNLSIDITPVSSLTAKLSVSHWCNTLSDGSLKNMVIADALLSFYVKEDVELRLSALNLLNTDRYSYTLFNGLTELSCEYKIRPFNVLAGVYFTF